jgi:hypothetical protein
MYLTIDQRLEKLLRERDKEGIRNGARYHVTRRGGPSRVTRRHSTSIRQHRMQIREFFLQHVQEGEDGCWLWTGKTDRHGYGEIYGDVGGKYKLLAVHRAAWEMVNGPVPKGLCVCHTCDVRHCVNPAHLFVGTNWDNVNDMLRKRHKRVERVVINGREMSLWEAAREFGTSDVYRSRIKRGWPLVDAVSLPVTWQHYKTHRR